MDIFQLKRKIDPIGFRIGYEEPSSVITMYDQKSGNAYILKEGIDEEVFYKKIMTSEKISEDFLMSFFNSFNEPAEKGVDY